jgi:hypothetical protein
MFPDKAKEKLMKASWTTIAIRVLALFTENERRRMSNVGLFVVLKNYINPYVIVITVIFLIECADKVFSKRGLYR